ncbi:MAG: ABC transporter substrate-binding protein, partial [Candidatus Methanomethyliaceae archaeon]
YSWHPSLTSAAQNFYNAYLNKYGEPPDLMGGGLSYTAVQILQQAIEKAGSIDREKVKHVLDTESFSTIIGNVTFGQYIEGGIHYNVNFIPPLGQIQDGKYEIVWPENIATAEVITKPPWP